MTTPQSCDPALLYCWPALSIITGLLYLSVYHRPRAGCCFARRPPRRHHPARRHPGRLATDRPGLHAARSTSGDAHPPPHPSLQRRRVRRPAISVPSIRRSLDAVRAARGGAARGLDPDNAAPVPVDLVTASGSGLDPEVSIAAIQYQISRVARARSMSPEALLSRLTAQHVGGAAGRLSRGTSGQRPRAEPRPRCPAAARGPLRRRTRGAPACTGRRDGIVCLLEDTCSDSCGTTGS